MYPLLLCSLVTWAVTIERMWSYLRLGSSLKAFHLEALNILLRGDKQALEGLCHRNVNIPTSQLIMVALERMKAKDVRLRDRWEDALERRRQLLNQELRQNLWMLGTIGSSAPFIGLFGTVVGILRSFHEMARTGTGGFSVVAAGISESLVATAAGIVVAVIAVMAFNAFQIHWNGLVLRIKIYTEELVEMLDGESVDGSST